MAAPHVSGVVGLIRAANPEYTAKQIRQLLRDSVKPAGPFNEPFII